MTVPKGASMSLTINDGKMVLVVSETMIETRAEAEEMSKLFTQFGASLPEKKSRSRSKPKSSRPTASRKAPSRKARPSGDAAAETATAS